MAILYGLRVKSSFDNLPPQILSSDWYQNIKRNVVEQSPNYYFKIFVSVDLFETWINNNRLTDSELISALNEWKAIDGNFITENYYELPSYSPGISGLVS